MIQHHPLYLMPQAFGHDRTPSSGFRSALGIFTMPHVVRASTRDFAVAILLDRALSVLRTFIQLGLEDLDSKSERTRFRLHVSTNAKDSVQNGNGISLQSGIRSSLFAR